MGRVGLNITAIYTSIQTHPVSCHPLLPCPVILCIIPPSVHLRLSLWAAWPWYPLVPPGSGARHPRFATVLSKPLVMATLAPAVVACAHSRPPAQSLSHPIYLTQTGASRPSPAYLSSAWFSLGVSNSPVPLRPGNCNEMRGRGLSLLSDWSCVWVRMQVFVEQIVRCCLWRKMGTTDSRENNQTHCQTYTHR